MCEGRVCYECRHACSLRTSRALTTASSSRPYRPPTRLTPECSSPQAPTTSDTVMMPLPPITHARLSDPTCTPRRTCTPSWLVATPLPCIYWSATTMAQELSTSTTRHLVMMGQPEVRVRYRSQPRVAAGRAPLACFADLFPDTSAHPGPAASLLSSPLPCPEMTPRRKLF